MTGGGPPVDPAFEGAGQKPGTEIWRIENFKLVKIPQSDHGKFYEGDSYVVLNTKQLRSGAFEWNIHFWLGKDTSQDEKGTAAIKAVELDDMLGGAPVQHRESQEHEAPQFLSLFKGGVRYLPGGIKSGFKHYDPKSAPPRLFHVKGKRNVRVREVPVTVKSMNKGDCFILDTPENIWVYVGRFSKRVERLKAIQAANQIRDQDHGGRLKVNMIDVNSSPDEVNAYFKALGGGSREEVADPPKEDDDETFEKMRQKVVTLYRVSDASGSVKVDKVGIHPLQGAMLSSEDCFVLDAGSSGIFAWIGRNCTKQEKLQVISTAEKFLKEKGYPEWTKIQRVVDGGEPTAFKQYFTVWKETDVVAPVYAREYQLEKQSVAETKKTRTSVPAMTRQERAKLLKNLGRALGFCPDDGNGKVDLWRIEKFELAPVAPAMHGIFFGGDSYVLQYTFKEGNREQYIIYYWLGAQSTQDEKASAALHAIALDDKLCGKATQVRVVQGHEPAHFLRIFKGRMIVFQGGHASGFRNVRERDDYDPTKPRLFHVRGTCDEDTRGVQVNCEAASLDSDDVFILDGPKAGVTYMWIGKHASEHEKKMGEKVDKVVSPDRTATRVEEGKESDEFWKLLGGKGPYTKDESLADTPALQARLFHCSIQPPSTKLEVEEVFNFDQEDLNEDDVMVLDTGDDEIFIWIGHGATKEEKKSSNQMADEYIKNHHMRAGGNCVTISIVVKQGQEPDAFKAFFPGWDDEHWKK